VPTIHVRISDELYRWLSRRPGGFRTVSDAVRFWLEFGRLIDQGRLAFMPRAVAEEVGRTLWPSAAEVGEGGEEEG